MVCTYDVCVMRSLDEAETRSVLGGLCGVIQATKDKVVCTRALWCLSRQTLDAAVLAQEVGY